MDFIIGCNLHKGFIIACPALVTCSTYSAFLTYFAACLSIMAITIIVVGSTKIIQVIIATTHTTATLVVATHQIILELINYSPFVVMFINQIIAAEMGLSAFAGYHLPFVGHLDIIMDYTVTTVGFDSSNWGLNIAMVNHSD